jgi:hypothetical protein
MPHDDGPVLVRSYRDNAEKTATEMFGEDAAALGRKGYVPVSEVTQNGRLLVTFDLRRSQSSRRLILAGVAAAVALGSALISAGAAWFALDRADRANDSAIRANDLLAQANEIAAAGQKPRPLVQLSWHLSAPGEGPCFDDLAAPGMDYWFDEGVFAFELVNAGSVATTLDSIRDVTVEREFDQVHVTSSLHEWAERATAVDWLSSNVGYAVPPDVLDNVKVAPMSLASGETKYDLVVHQAVNIVFPPSFNPGEVATNIAEGGGLTYLVRFSFSDGGFAEKSVPMAWPNEVDIGRLPVATAWPICARP